jgi:hypothetical protein
LRPTLINPCPVALGLHRRDDMTGVADPSLRAVRGLTGVSSFGSEGSALG